LKTAAPSRGARALTCSPASCENFSACPFVDIEELLSTSCGSRAIVGAPVQLSPEALSDIFSETRQTIPSRFGPCPFDPVNPFVAANQRATRQESIKSQMQRSRIEWVNAATPARVNAATPAPATRRRCMGTEEQSVEEGLYRKPIDEQRGLTPFGSDEGQRILGECIVAGTAKAYFPLAEQFMTQSDPPFCGPTTIVMVLNSLKIDPKQVWKSPWRWYTEHMLKHCAPLDFSQGLTMEEFAHLAESNHTDVESFYAGHRGLDLDSFRQRIRDSLFGPAASSSRIVVSFSRPALGQTGDGHYSPIAAYHESTDSVLVMDVARFKYPPYWVPLSLLWKAMCSPDAMTGRARGFFVVSKPERSGEMGDEKNTSSCAECSFGTREACHAAEDRTTAGTKEPSLASMVLSRLADGAPFKPSSVSNEDAAPALINRICKETLAAVVGSDDGRAALRKFQDVLRMRLVKEREATEQALTRLYSSDLCRIIGTSRVSTSSTNGAHNYEGVWQAHPQRASELTTLFMLALAQPLCAPGGPLAEPNISSDSRRGCNRLLGLLDRSSGGRTNGAHLDADDLRILHDLASKLGHLIGTKVVVASKAHELHPRATHDQSAPTSDDIAPSWPFREKGPRPALPFWPAWPALGNL